MHKHLHPVVTQALVVAAAAVVAACGSSSTGHASDTATASLQPTTPIWAGGFDHAYYRRPP